MGMIQRLAEPESRAATQVLPAALIRGPTISGVTVGQDTALGYSAVFAAVNGISSSVGTLPLKLYRRDGRERVELPDHPLYDVLHLRPNRHHNAMEWRAVLQGHLLTRGDCFSEIRRNRSGEITELIPLNPDRVDIELDVRTRRRRYLVSFDDMNDQMELPQESVFHVPGPGFDGIRGWSVIALARQSIGLGLAMEQYQGAFFGNSAAPSGILSTPNQLDDESQARLVSSWEKAHRGLSNAHRVAVLEEGLEWTQIGLTAEDSQFLESRAFGVREVARWFNIPPHKLRDMEDATFSNIEQQHIEYYTDTLLPWITRWEQAASLQLLTGLDRQRGLYVEFSVEGLLRGDSEKRGAFYDTMTKIGAMTLNEVRAKENLPPVEGGDTPFVRLDTIPLDRMNEWVDQQLAPAAPLPILRENSRRGLIETRATDRLGVAGEFSDLLAGAARRMVRREVRRIRQLMEDLLADDPAEFIAAVDRFYREAWPADVIAIMGPALRAFIAAVARAASSDIGREQPALGEFPASYVDTFADRYSASSRRTIQRIAQEGDVEALEERLAQWDTGAAEVASRGDQWASRELSQALNAASKAVFVAAGLLTLRWVTRGDSCPMCRQLSGRVVFGDVPFVPKGTTVVGDDGRRITPRSSIGHPPLHNGCDCYVAPG